MRSSSWKVWLTALAPALFIGLAGASRPALEEHSFEVVKGFEVPDQGSNSLVVGSDGALYGTTPSGGPFSQGRFFRIDAEGTFSALYSFDGTEGSGRSALVLGSNDPSGTDPQVHNCSAGRHTTICGACGCTPARRAV